MTSETRREKLRRLIREYAAVRESYPRQQDWPGISDEALEYMQKEWRERVEVAWNELDEAIARYVPIHPARKHKTQVENDPDGTYGGTS